ncbi:hypothetical protein RvY_11944-2 [Ramazzottius varieornatus]|uniref:Saposin B-type domain-containing protein n=1 Tax=Ramazzottius varieornatus TaxID=947166 RepID=A0A1D1VK75_RAMVA|nr:hypothetical protein RvY_11944-2 [Ramazzottius varieornatus]
MITAVAVVALLLSVPTKQDVDETSLAYTERLAKQVRSYGDWINIFITLATAALRTSVCLHCSSQVRKIYRCLQRHRGECELLGDEAMCTQILAELDTSLGSISASGVFFINLHYVAKNINSTNVSRCLDPRKKDQTKKKC